jgi:hypothetical protein
VYLKFKSFLKFQKKNLKIQKWQQEFYFEISKLKKYFSFENSKEKFEKSKKFNYL